MKASATPVLPAQSRGAPVLKGLLVCLDGAVAETTPEKAALLPSHSTDNAPGSAQPATGALRYPISIFTPLNETTGVLGQVTVGHGLKLDALAAARGALLKSVTNRHLTEHPCHHIRQTSLSIERTVAHSEALSPDPRNGHFTDRWKDYSDEDVACLDEWTDGLPTFQGIACRQRSDSALGGRHASRTIKHLPGMSNHKVL
jgi:hypothetical protein